VGKKDEDEHKVDPATKEAWDYLMEVMGDYETFLGNIGDLGYSAPQLLYYRDEVQEFLEELTDNPQVNYKGAFQKVNALDVILREKAQDLVNEIGHENFLQYQVINDPPKKHWWWWMNRVTSPPPPPPKLWEFWKYDVFKSKPEEAKKPQGPPPKNPDIAKIFQTDEDSQQQILESLDDI
jgi:hypothetical protein